MDNISAVLFDFDGVLGHTIPIYKQAIFTFFKQKQLAVSENDFEQDGWASKSLEQLCEILASKYDIQLSSDELRKQIWQTQVDMINMGLESDPTLIPFLEFCEKTGKKLAI